MRLSSLRGRRAKKLPAEVERLLNGAVLVRALRDIAFFKLVGKLGVQQVSRAQRRLAQDGHELLVLLTGGIGREELVHRAGVVLAGLARADALVLQTGQARQHVHRRIDAAAVQLAAKG